MCFRNRLWALWEYYVNEHTSSYKQRKLPIELIANSFILKFYTVFCVSSPPLTQYLFICTYLCDLNSIIIIIIIISVGNPENEVTNEQHRLASNESVIFIFICKVCLSIFGGRINVVPERWRESNGRRDKWV
jgi:hypothetical protein